MTPLPLRLLPFLLLPACTPTVQVQAPDKPIEINLNVTIEQHVKIAIEKDVQQAIAKNKSIF
ncbi:MAG: YnbE family lipoprotein [Alphaproteobacteria bacterium]|nr:YnbE family lipoprotein [Alphaproteobacteria bacterium]